MSDEPASTPRFGRDWSDLAAGRKWSGLPLRVWRLARAEGHHLCDGQPGESFSMNRGFHCPCGRWTLPHDGGVVSDVREGYRRWGEHVVAAYATPSDSGGGTEGAW